MKKLLIILGFMIIGLFGYQNRVDAQDCQAIYDGCLSTCNGTDTDCGFCETSYHECVANNPQPTSEPTCEDKCKNYAEGEAREVCECRCNGNIVLNTKIPFLKTVGKSGRCLEKTSGTTAISGVSQTITRILMTLILIWGFGNLIYAGVQFASNNPTAGKKRIINTVVAFAVIGSIGLILRLINPNIFK